MPKSAKRTALPSIKFDAPMNDDRFGKLDFIETTQVPVGELAIGM